MNVVVTVFYALCGAWIIALTVFAIIKKVKFNKAKKKLKKEVENDEAREKAVSKVEE